MANDHLASGFGYQYLYVAYLILEILYRYYGSRRDTTPSYTGIEVGEDGLRSSRDSLWEEFFQINEVSNI